MNIAEDIVAFGISANNEIAKRDEKIKELEQQLADQKEISRSLQQQIINNTKKD